MATKTAAKPITGRGRIQSIEHRLLMQLPDDASRDLPSRGQVAVHAVLNGHAFTTVLESDGNKGHWLAIDGDLAESAHAQPGETASFEFTPTKAWPEPNVPSDLQEALDAEPATAQPWADITPMARWEWVRWVNATKNSETRARRIEVSVSKLLDGKRRPCCFDLSSCTDPEVSRSGKLIDV